jgi:hypothetical protein
MWQGNGWLGDRRMPTIQTAVVYRKGGEVPVLRAVSPLQYIQWILITKTYQWIENRYLSFMAKVNGWGFNEQETTDEQETLQ